MRLPKYVIAWEDPGDPALPIQITVPTGGWLDLQAAIGLTEEQAMELLVMRILPRYVWDPTVRRNRPLFKIVLRAMIPSDRTWRNAWRLANG